MTYSELLKSKYWERKRSEILNRDKNKCQNCNNSKHLNHFYITSIRISFYNGRVMISGFSHELKMNLRFISDFNFNDFIKIISINKDARTLAIFSYKPQNEYQNLVALIDVPKFKSPEKPTLIKENEKQKYDIIQNKFEEDFVKACNENEILIDELSCKESYFLLFKE